MYFAREEIQSGCITKIDNDKITIQKRDVTCSKGESHCDSGCGACSGQEVSSEMVIFNSMASHYKIGQEITFKHFSINGALLAFFVFGFPISNAVITLLFWKICSPSSVESPFAILTTVVIFILSFSSVYFVDRYIRKKYPSIILTPPDLK